MINIKGLDKAELLVELYNHSHQQGMGMLQPVRSLTVEDARKLLEQSQKFDYLYGKIMKINLSGDEFNEWLYDRDNGQGMAQSVVDGMRKKCSKKDELIEPIQKNGYIEDKTINNLIEHKPIKKYIDKTDDIMNLDYDKLNELMGVFGLFLKLENGNVFFVDVETNTLMKSYVIHKDGFADQKVEYTSEADTLLCGLPFYLENSEKKYSLRIFEEDNNFMVKEIERVTNLYERTALEINYHSLSNAITYNLEELTLGSNFTRTSFKVFGMNKHNGEISVETHEHPIAGITLKKDSTTRLHKDVYNEITDKYGFFSDGDLSLQDVESLIDQSEMLKKTMAILCPNTAEAYSNIKTNSYGPTK